MGTLGHRHQAEVTITPRERFIAPDDAEHRQSQRHQCVAEQHLVTGAADAVENDSCQLHRRIQRGKSVNNGSHRLAHGRRIHHQNHRCIDELGHVGGGRWGAITGPVEQTHHPLHNQYVAPMGGPSGQWTNGLHTAHPGIKIAARAAGGQGVVAGVDEVRAHLGRRHPHSSRGQGGHQSGGHRSFAHAGVCSRDDETGTEDVHGQRT